MFESHHRHQKEGIRKDALFLVPRLRRGLIRFAQIDGRGRCAPSHTLPKGRPGKKTNDAFPCRACGAD